MLVKIARAKCLSVLGQGGQNAGHSYICNQHKDTIALHLQKLKCPFCVTFDFGSNTFEAYDIFYYQKDIWIASMD